MKRSASPKRKSRVKQHNPKRKAKELLRAYGPPERREWMRMQASVASGKGPCVNAHVKNGGAGRKADAQWIVPLTDEEHRELHAIGVESFEQKHGLSLEFMATQTALRWLAYIRSQHAAD